MGSFSHRKNQRTPVLGINNELEKALWMGRETGKVGDQIFLKMGKEGAGNIAQYIW